jgi:hypothetical protein
VKSLVGKRLGGMHADEAAVAAGHDEDVEPPHGGRTVAAPSSGGINMGTNSSTAAQEFSSQTGQSGFTVLASTASRMASTSGMAPIPPQVYADGIAAAPNF